MNPSDLEKIIAHQEALQLQLWAFSGLVFIMGGITIYFLKADWEWMKATLRLNEKDIAELKHAANLKESFEQAAQVISDAIDRKTERIRGQR